MAGTAPHRYFIHLAYNGAGYHGWQKQDNAATVQEALTEAISTITGNEVSLVGCGRTDTGVHAKDFYAHFEMFSRLSSNESDQLTYRLNRFLPNDIVIYRILEVPADLHARFSATRRTYRYYIHTFKDPFLNNVSWFVHDKPDINRMNSGAGILQNYKDFTSFSKLHSAAKTNICHIMDARWSGDGHRMVFTITADRFLRNMVRAVVGTLVDLGQDKIDLKELREIIESKNRSDAGQSVPAHGLFLENVEYPPEYDELLQY